MYLVNINKWPDALGPEPYDITLQLRKDQIKGFIDAANLASYCILRKRNGRRVIDFKPIHRDRYHSDSYLSEEEVPVTPDTLHVKEISSASLKAR